MTTFLCYDKCSTCQKARKWLDEQGAAYTARPIKEQNPTAAELETRRTRMTGTTSPGIWRSPAGPSSAEDSASRNPEARSTPTAVISPMSVGRIPPPSASRFSPRR